MKQYFNNKDFQIRYHKQGKGKTVVLLHGYLESLDIFSNFSERLSQNYQIISLDLPGHGKSEFKKNIHNIEEMAKAVFQLTQHLQLTKINLIGHSMGGYVSLAFAELFPEKLESICLLHSSPNADTEEKKANRKREIELIQKGKKELICKSSIPNTFSNSNQEKFQNKINEIVNSACKTKDEGIVVALSAMMNRIDRNELLLNLTIPKLSIIGKLDNFIPFESGIQIANRNKMQTIILEHSGHMGFIEEEEKCFEQLHHFLSSFKTL